MCALVLSVELVVVGDDLAQVVAGRLDAPPPQRKRFDAVPRWRLARGVWLAPGPSKVSHPIQEIDSRIHDLYWESRDESGREQLLSRERHWTLSRVPTVGTILLALGSAVEAIIGGKYCFD